MRLAFTHNGLGSVFARLKDFDDASHAYQEALNFVSPAPDSAHHSEDLVYAVADAYAGLADVEAERAAAMLRNRAVRLSYLRQALVWSDRSLELWQRVKEPGLLSPSGFDCTPVHEVRTRRARISAELAAVEATGM